VEKRVGAVAARHLATGDRLAGYEIHLGQTDGPDCARAWLELDGADGPRKEGAASEDGRVTGCYLHGLFASDGFRANWLARFGVQSGLDYGADVERVLDALADHIEAHMDLNRMLEIARQGAD